jgi:hypothetical protein
MVATATRRTLKSLSNGSRRAQKPFLSFGAPFSDWGVRRLLRRTLGSHHVRHFCCKETRKSVGLKRKKEREREKRERKREGDRGRMCVCVRVYSITWSFISRSASLS